MKPIRACLVGMCLFVFFLTSSTALAQGDTGSITGRVTDEATGQPLSAPGVIVYNLAGDSVGVSGPLSPEGSYVIDALAPGSYKLQWVDSSLQGYQVEWWQDQPDFDSADIVEVFAGEVTAGIDFVVSIPPPAPGGFLEGHLTDLTAGTPVPEGFRLGIDVHEPSGETLVMSAVAWTDAAGWYRLGPVPEGTYKLKFVDGSLFVYGEEWWQDKTDFAMADAVDIRLDEVTVVDWALEQKAAIPGTPQVNPQLPFTGLPVAWVAVIGLGLVVAGSLALVSVHRRLP